MTEMFAHAALWLAPAIVATILANRLKVSMALTEICVGMAAGYAFERWFGDAFFGAKSASKIFGLFPFIARFRQERNERWYYTLMMSTGLTFGTISALYGLTHGIVTREQYSFLVAAVIASAVIPTLVATFAFTPRHLLPAEVPTERPAMEREDGLGDE